ncbi:MAG TPA: BatD family protein [Saprospiraceae bacterium]|nr:BatD family protein [Saprospiraceae bacterium]
MLSRFRLALVFIIFVHIIQAQSPRFIMRTDRTTVAEGETFILEAVLENIDTKSIKLPDVSPFKIVQGPSTSTSLSIVNGKSSGSYSQKYLLQAPKSGKYKLSPATAQLGNKTIRTNEIVVEVVKQHVSALPDKTEAKSETFFRIETSSEKAYIGQQVVLNYVIYTRQNLSSYNIVDEPKPEGFFAEPLNDVQDPAQRKMLNGKEYYTQVVRRLILYPQKKGNFTIGPVKFSVEIPVENGNSSFFFVETERKILTSNTIKLTVSDPPKEAPTSFCGGVGTFEMRATVNKSTVKIGEAINVIMTVSGDGDSRLLKAPEWSYPAGLVKYEPSTTTDETLVVGDRKKITKVFEYIFVPSKDSIYTLKPELSYFSPETGKFETITVGPFNVNVTKSFVDNGVNNIGIVKSHIDELKSDAHSIFSITQSPWFSTWHLGGILTIIISSLFGIFYKKRNIQKSKDGQILQTKAGFIAMKNLEKANKFMLANNPSAFYEEISQATTGYIQKKYNISNAESSIHDVIHFLNGEKVDEEVVEKYKNIQKTCEIARFAGIHNGNMGEVYQDALWLINSFEDK